jgi:hypothetical protein
MDEAMQKGEGDAVCVGVPRLCLCVHEKWSSGCQSWETNPPKNKASAPNFPNEPRQEEAKRVVCVVTILHEAKPHAATEPSNARVNV